MDIHSLSLFQEIRSELDLVEQVEAGGHGQCELVLVVDVLLKV